MRRIQWALMLALTGCQTAANSEPSVTGSSSTNLSIEDRTQIILDVSHPYFLCARDEAKALALRLPNERPSDIGVAAAVRCTDAKTIIREVAKQLYPDNHAAIIASVDRNFALIVTAVVMENR